MQKILLILFIVFISSCNIIKNAEIAHANKKITKLHDKYPDIVQSKLALWYPPLKQDTIVKQGKPIVIITKVTDTSKANYLNKKIDSLFDNNTALKNLLNQVPDIDSLKAAIQAQVLEGCVSFDDTSTTIYDTTNIIPTNTVLQISNLLSDTSKKHDTILQLTTQYNTADKSSNKWMWYFFGLLLSVGIYTSIKIYLKVKSVA